MMISRLRVILVSVGISALLSGWAFQSHASHPKWLTFGNELGSAVLLNDGMPEISDERAGVLRSDGIGVVELLRRYRLKVGADGRLVERVYLVRRFLSDDGVRDMGNVSIAVRPAFADLKILTILSIAPGESSVVVKPDTIQVVNASTPDVFSDAVSVIIPYAQLKPGSTIIMIVEKTLNMNRWPLPWSRFYWPQGVAPVERFEVDVEWGEGAKEPAWTSTLKDYECDQTSPSSVSCSSSSIPAIEEDPDVASWADRLPTFIVGEKVDWREVADAEGGLVEDAISGVLPKMNLELESSKKARLEEIYRFVSDEIRYVAFEGGNGAVVPRQAGLTFERGYGDCKDKVALFVALARREGLDAYPVLVASSRYQLEPLVVPSWRWFDHMMACVDGIDRHPICLELTTPYSGVGELPVSLHGAVMLDLRTKPGIRSAPTTLRPPPRSWQIRASSTNHIECNGTLEEETTLVFEGGLAVWMRSSLMPLTSDARIRWLEDLYKDAVGARAIPRFEVDGLESPGEPVTIAAFVQHTGLGDPLEWTSYTEIDAWLRYFTNSMRTSNRNHPFRMVGMDISTNNQYSFCEGVKISRAGADLDLEADLGVLTRKSKVRPNSIRIESEMRLGRRQVEVEDLDRFDRLMEAMVTNSQIEFGLEGKQ